MTKTPKFVTKFLGVAPHKFIFMTNTQIIEPNFLGVTPEKLNYDFFKEKNIDKIGLTSPHSVTIPGAVHAWETIHKEFGKLDFEQLFSGAINIAKNGHKISKVVSQAWQNSLNKINGNENSKKIFLSSILCGFMLGVSLDKSALIMWSEIIHPSMFYIMPALTLIFGYFI